MEAGEGRPDFAMVPLAHDAYTAPTNRVSTNTVPFDPTAIERALVSPVARSSIAKPRGSLIQVNGIAFALFVISAGGFGTGVELPGSGGCS
jgi:hypothetical protein